MTTNWIARFHDDEDRDAAEVERLVRDALGALSLRVANVNRPLQINPDPLRGRETPK